MTEATTIADKLAVVGLSLTKDPASAGVLLNAAPRKTDLPFPGAAVEHSTALALLKSTPEKVTALARSCDDPALLDRMAKDTRLCVRRAVAENPHTTPEARRALLAWATKVEDVETLVALASFIPRAVFESVDAKVLEGTFGIAAAIAQAVLVEDDPEFIRTVFLTCNAQRGLICARVAEQEPDGVSLEDLLELCAGDEEDEGFVAYMLMKTLEVITPSFVRFLAARPDFAQRLELSSPRRVTFSPGALALAVELPARVLLCAMAWQENRDVLDHVIASGDATALTELSRHASAFDGALCASLGHALLENECEPDALVCYLGAPNADRDLVLELLRCSGNSKVITRWVSGGFKAKPRPGDVRSLLCDSAHPVQTEDGERIDLRAADLPQMLSHPWVDELVDAAGPNFFALMASTQMVVRTSGPLQYAFRRITDELEDSAFVDRDRAPPDRPLDW